VSTSSPNADRRGCENRDAPAAAGTCPFAPPPQYLRPPRLGIIHLLAWTAATAVMLKFYVAAQDNTDTVDLSAIGDAAHQTIQFVNSARVGATLVGATVLVLGRVRGETGRFQPGHWFILIETVADMLGLTFWAISLALRQPGTEWYEESFYKWYLGLWGAIAVCIAVAYFFVARRVRHDRPWRTPAVVMAIVDLIVGNLCWLALLTWMAASAMYWPIWPLIVGVTFFVALLIDVGRGAGRDWVHWLGVAIIITTSTMHVASWAVFRLMLTP
jgi:hypothetical protein